MRVSRLLLVLVALVAGGLAAWLAFRPGEPAPSPEVQVVAETHSKVLIAKTDIGLGERLSDQNLDWQDWPDGAVRPEYITATQYPDAIASMKDAVARNEIFAGEPVRESKLVHSTQGYMSAVLDKGMRGVSIAVTADSASGGFIVPNDHVDLILTRPTPQGQESETLLSNVRVLAINARLGETGTTGNPDGTDPKEANAPFANTAIATLELDPAQAETVANAVQQGKIALSLRSIVDFSPDPNAKPELRRNAPIKIIRYGLEANVIAGAGSGATAGTGEEVPTDLPTSSTAMPTMTITQGPAAVVTTPPGTTTP